jgi:hypothetical protein
VDFDYIRLIGELNDERLKFYECLAHNLIVSVRASWSDEGLTEGEKVGSLKWLNKIMHRLTRTPSGPKSRQLWQTSIRV